ncbi:MAG TPA: hypothetical protein VIU11_28160 [Nakamurella sp.]
MVRHDAHRGLGRPVAHGGAQNLTLLLSFVLAGRRGGVGAPVRMNPAAP